VPSLSTKMEGVRFPWYSWVRQKTVGAWGSRSRDAGILRGGLAEHSSSLWAWVHQGGTLAIGHQQDFAEKTVFLRWPHREGTQPPRKITMSPLGPVRAVELDGPWPLGLPGAAVRGTVRGCRPFVGRRGARLREFLLPLRAPQHWSADAAGVCSCMKAAFRRPTGLFRVGWTRSPDGFP